MRHLIMAAAAMLAIDAHAASVNKCVDAAGKITFTQQACPGGQQPDEVVRAHNPAPSGGTEVVEMVSPEWRSFNEPEPTRSQTKVTVVGGRDERTCSTGLSERDERTATVRGQAMRGMNRAQIESIYGKPDTTSTANGRVNYRYWNARNREYVSIRFDEYGCADWVYQSKDE